MKMLKAVRRFLRSIWAVGVLAPTANWAQNATTPAVTPNHPADQQTVSELYRIGIKDVLSITVWKEPELSGQVTVRPDGKITIPLLNEIKAVGLTPSQLQTLLTEQLKPFLNAPQVTVSVRGIRAEPPPDPRKFRAPP